jgi:hypothetical protein
MGDNMHQFKDKLAAACKAQGREFDWRPKVRVTKHSELCKKGEELDDSPVTRIISGA